MPSPRIPSAPSLHAPVRTWYVASPALICATSSSSRPGAAMTSAHSRSSSVRLVRPGAMRCSLLWRTATKSSSCAPRAKGSCAWAPRRCGGVRARAPASHRARNYSQLKLHGGRARAGQLHCAPPTPLPPNTCSTSNSSCSVSHIIQSGAAGAGRGGRSSSSIEVSSTSLTAEGSRLVTMRAECSSRRARSTARASRAADA
jgi:hypothetical protein